jgi:hypothetical protein
VFALNGDYLKLQPDNKYRLKPDRGDIARGSGENDVYTE